MRELLSALPYMSVSGSLCKQDVENRFNAIGGIPRIVFGSTDAYLEHRARQSEQINNLAMLRDILRGSLLESLPGSPTYLFGYTAHKPFTWAHKHVTCVSAGARRKIFRAHYNFMMNMLSTGFEPAVEGFRFEDFCEWLLVEGGAELGWDARGLQCMKWEPKSTKGSNEWKAAPAFTFHRCNLQTSSSHDEAKEIWREWIANRTTGVLRTAKGHPLAAFILSATHALQTTLESLQELPNVVEGDVRLPANLDLKQLTITYLIPEDKYHEFTLTPKTSRARYGSIQKVRLPMRVEQPFGRH